MYILTVAAYGELIHAGRQFDTPGELCEFVGARIDDAAFKNHTVSTTKRHEAFAALHAGMSKTDDFCFMLGGLAVIVQWVQS